MDIKENLQSDLENFICNRLDATLWENEQFDKDTILFANQVNEIENSLIKAFGEDTEISKSLNKIKDLLVLESVLKQQRAYAMGLKDGLNLENTLTVLGGNC